MRRTASRLPAIAGNAPSPSTPRIHFAALRGSHSTQRWMHEQLDSILRSTMIFGVIWVVASVLLVLLMGRSIARPIAVLHRGAAALMTSPEDGSHFPLPVVVHNEIGDLIETFNRMVASLAEQRAGLNDTLSLLDSMLANAPIGLAFVDRSCRFVRVNQVFADLTGVAVSRHLGRTLPELLPQSAAKEMEGAVQRVFATEEPVRNLEIERRGRRTAPAVDLADQRLPGADHAEPGALGRDHCARRERAQAQRRGAAPERKARGDRAAGRFHCPRDQQSPRSHHQFAFSAAQLQRASGRGAAVRVHGRVRGAAHRRDYAADAALLPPAHAAGAHHAGGTAGSGAEPLPEPPQRTQHSCGAGLRGGDDSVLLCRRDPAGLRQPGGQCD